MDLKLTRLSDIDVAELVALHSDARVRRHMPLADYVFDESACRKWVECKERQWKINGYGPWAFLIDGRFAGWGGLQLENGDADLALVLFPEYWGRGRAVYREILARAFGDMGFESITALLPPGRDHVKGMLRLGFQTDGQVEIAGTSFVRYRLWAPKPGGTTKSCG